MYTSAAALPAEPPLGDPKTAVEGTHVTLAPSPSTDDDERPLDLQPPSPAKWMVEPIQPGPRAPPSVQMVASAHWRVLPMPFFQQFQSLISRAPSSVWTVAQNLELALPMPFFQRLHRRSEYVVDPLPDKLTIHCFQTTTDNKKGPLSAPVMLGVNGHSTDKFFATIISHVSHGMDFVLVNRDPLTMIRLEGVLVIGQADSELPADLSTKTAEGADLCFFPAEIEITIGTESPDFDFMQSWVHNSFPFTWNGNGKYVAAEAIYSITHGNRCKFYSHPLGNGTITTSFNRETFNRDPKSFMRQFMVTLKRVPLHKFLPRREFDSDYHWHDDVTGDDADDDDNDNLRGHRDLLRRYNGKLLGYKMKPPPTPAKDRQQAKRNKTVPSNDDDDDDSMEDAPGTPDSMKQSLRNLSLYYNDDDDDDDDFMDESKMQSSSAFLKPLPLQDLFLDEFKLLCLQTSNGRCVSAMISSNRNSRAKFFATKPISIYHPTLDRLLVHGLGIDIRLEGIMVAGERMTPVLSTHEMYKSIGDDVTLSFFSVGEGYGSVLGRRLPDGFQLWETNDFPYRCRPPMRAESELIYRITYKGRCAFYSSPLWNRDRRSFKDPDFSNEQLLLTLTRISGSGDSDSDEVMDAGHTHRRLLELYDGKLLAFEQNKRKRPRSRVLEL